VETVYNIHRGQFGLNTTGYVGFRTDVNGGAGWLKIHILDRNSDGYPDQAVLISYAYNNVAGGTILAGQTTDALSTPEPGTASLALLAAGAAGVLALRRRRRGETAS